MQAPYFNTHFTAEKVPGFVSSHPVTILSYHFFSSIKFPKKKIHVRIDEILKCGLKWFLRILTHVFKAHVFFGIEYLKFWLEIKMASLDLEKKSTHRRPKQLLKITSSGLPVSIKSVTLI